MKLGEQNHEKISKTLELLVHRSFVASTKKTLGKHLESNKKLDHQSLELFSRSIIAQLHLCEKPKHGHLEVK